MAFPCYISASLSSPSPSSSFRGCIPLKLNIRLLCSHRSLKLSPICCASSSTSLGDPDHEFLQASIRLAGLRDKYALQNVDIWSHGFGQDSICLHKKKNMLLKLDLQKAWLGKVDKEIGKIDEEIKIQDNMMKVNQEIGSRMDEAPPSSGKRKRDPFQSLLFYLIKDSSISTWGEPICVYLNLALREMSGETAVTAMETTETANQSCVKIDSNKADTTDMELQILAAMRSRVTYLRNKADSVTFASVRRLLEEDMGLEKYALDAHKSFVKEHLVKCLEDPGDGASDNNPQETDDATPVKEVANASEENQVKKDVREETGDEALMSDIKRALRKRTSYIKANSEEITMASLRRLLEEDLKLKKDSLVPFKKFINKELDDVLQIPDVPKHSTKPTSKSVKKNVKSTPPKKLGSEDDSDSDADEVPEKKTLTQNRKRKIENVKPVAGKKKTKDTEADSDSENDSDAGDSGMRVVKPSKTATTVYGKRVDHLKSVIKSCGMSIPPIIYRKVKQAPEEKREATLIEELEQILAKEGLSSDPSEKEIKEVKKKKDRTKELEGIDTSNIVSSSRRRSTTSFAPPPKPKITSESESESDEEESENGEENEEEEGNEEVAEEGSQSEEESNNGESPFHSLLNETLSLKWMINCWPCLQRMVVERKANDLYVSSMLVMLFYLNNSIIYSSLDLYLLYFE
ncbi:unnamed protein product [Eruca vesicaria subsp. sativa]|uniref:DEK-C domain-containing protein n=1 Tax=Eruca vesicaria subsp. sativa TaxID=29727 RepID=A0ABC8LIK4_ERUVS|nr:unnamed protein product [Eruca vesicaria subsp. sativa]